MSVIVDNRHNLPTVLLLAHLAPGSFIPEASSSESRCKEVCLGSTDALPMTGETAVDGVVGMAAAFCSDTSR